jgi:ribosomal protein L40E
VADTIRCPFCGGLNPADAQWCGQCLTRFAEHEESSEPPPASEAPPATEEPPATEAPAPASAVEAHDEAPRDPARPPAAVAPGGAGPGAASGRAFAVSAEGITWTCPTCETPNPIDADTCSVCGTTFAQMVHPEREIADKDPNTAALISLFFPGAGHAYLGLWADAIARGVLSVWVVLVAVVAAFAGEQASGRLVTIMFAAVAFGLWAVGAHDAYRAARKERDRVILKGRGFLFLVLGLLGLLLLVLVGSALGARR